MALNTSLLNLQTLVFASETKNSNNRKIWGKKKSLVKSWCAKILSSKDCKESNKSSGSFVARTICSLSTYPWHITGIHMIEKPKTRSLKKCIFTNLSFVETVVTMQGRHKGGTLGASVPPMFGRTVNPISTRGEDYDHHSTTSPLKFSDLATAL